MSAIGALADLLARFVGADSVRIMVALGLGLAALYARRTMAMGRMVGRAMSIAVVVLVVLAVSIGTGVLSPNLSVLTGAVSTVLEWVSNLIR